MSRLRNLVRCITPHLREGDCVLDVGCGFGTLGKALLDTPLCPLNLRVEGLERVKRGKEPIKVLAYDGMTIPHPDNTYDVVILADVLHHEHDPDRLIGECIRISRRLVIIKDHQLKGLLSWLRVSFIDWAANAPYGVPCLYRYNTPKQWINLRHQHKLTIIEEKSSMQLYPPVVNLLFGRSLQYLAVMQVPDFVDD
ncbi:class I SAM-dependent methyltransferase [Nostoc sp. CCY 9925]|uniref:class I SAM-dependent methyltransferase n=1 Tax=Nostoc sp. CCY 9925 TaxID=3103865 RepID=UPI0039C75BE2